MAAEAAPTPSSSSSVDALLVDRVLSSLIGSSAHGDAHAELKQGDVGSPKAVEGVLGGLALLRKWRRLSPGNTESTFGRYVPCLPSGKCKPSGMLLFGRASMLPTVQIKSICVTETMTFHFEPNSEP
eukprot:TRINITY_DN35100_c0_g1_i1.p2 TRINITY_DN35100_c0_g1~~TRINITY_DN35100_c0_g1_i1.p2  ORF type:complete len:127 (-),score=10.44 TRINITY_DN35100_c0_g1_i1:8-388(-)